MNTTEGNLRTLKLDLPTIIAPAAISYPASTAFSNARRQYLTYHIDNLSIPGRFGGKKAKIPTVVLEAWIGCNVVLSIIRIYIMKDKHASTLIMIGIPCKGPLNFPFCSRSRLLAVYRRRSNERTWINA